MKPVKLFLIVMCLGLLMACGGGTSSNESDDNTVELSKQDQANLVATALSSQSSGVEDDINTAAGAADGDAQAQSKSRAADLSLSERGGEFNHERRIQGRALDADDSAV